MLIRRRVRLRILAVAQEWGIQRERIPRDLLVTLEEDFAKQLTTRVLGLLNSTRQPPKKKQPGPKTPRKTDRTARAD